ncbi:DUF4174 domain-containing protein [Deinococcus altitudinis]|uniref:DUF4174 domain-containing protein n=1 Tax=Deinococcus altitudinis TaxID=468914 RepID=UPI003891D0E5
MSRSVSGPLAALVTVVGSVSALPINSPAPTFTLADGKGQPWKLADHLGRERLLVVGAPSAAYLDEIVRQTGLLQDRDLRVVALVLPGDAALKRGAGSRLTVLADPGGRVAARSGRAVLIGKDRGVKATYTSPPSLNTVLGLIDTMPMRQQEQRTRGR